MNLKEYTGAPLLLTCLVFSAPAFAAIKDIEAANNQFSAQFHSRDMDHTETANGTVLDTEDARLPGYGFAASIMRDLWLGRDFLEAEYSSFHGESNYIGSTIGNPAYGSLTGKSGARIEDASLRYGNGYVIDSETMVTPYGELGYHKYRRTIGNGTPAAYLETYTHYYYGIGVMGQVTPGDGVVLSANVLIGRTVAPGITVGLPAPFGFSAGLGSSTLYRVGAAVDYALAPRLHASLGVDYMSWKYGASASHAAGFGIPLYEPDSRTNNATIKTGIGYSF